ncbi:MAG: hypothetical protein JRC59_00385 [Deltaproteobacteria bacterium]|nr:hypothetical protein [Deltaproteobacteria bacterium]
MAVLIASIFSMPLAYFTSRFEFKGAVIIQRMGIIPLIMPPFIGAVAMLMLFGRNGSVNLLLDQWFGWRKMAVNKSNRDQIVVRG